MNLTKIQKEFLNQIWDGVEYCPHCDRETVFEFNPIKDKDITCSNCGKRIHPCSLCHGDRCWDDCLDCIRETLLRENDRLESEW